MTKPRLIVAAGILTILVPTLTWFGTSLGAAEGSNAQVAEQGSAESPTYSPPVLESGSEAGDFELLTTQEVGGVEFGLGRYTDDDGDTCYQIMPGETSLIGSYSGGGTCVSGSRPPEEHLDVAVSGMRVEQQVGESLEGPYAPLWYTGLFGEVSPEIGQVEAVFASGPRVVYPVSQGGFMLVVPGRTPALEVRALTPSGSVAEIVEICPQVPSEVAAIVCGA